MSDQVFSSFTGRNKKKKRNLCLKIDYIQQNFLNGGLYNWFGVVKFGNNRMFLNVWWPKQLKSQTMKLRWQHARCCVTWFHCNLHSERVAQELFPTMGKQGNTIEHSLKHLSSGLRLLYVINSAYIHFYCTHNIFCFSRNMMV